MSTMSFETRIGVSFGDCDPAGIVFYPRYFAWFDATYHAFLKHLGLPHAELCARLDCLGTGVMETGGEFLSPASDGDVLEIVLTMDEWRERSFKLLYAVEADGRSIMRGFEIRGLFMRSGERLKAASVAPLKALIEERCANG